MELPAEVLESRRLVWGIAYRMTGSAADADDVLQETLERAALHPPARLDEPWRPWLVRVAMNAARDVLRKRRRRPYVGPWLPSPVEAEEATAPAAESPTARYDLHESASYAFLAALEVLSAQQRGVLLLRDVLDCSVSETAAMLRLSESNVKVTHHRARRAMAAYDASRATRGRALAADTRAALERFLGAILRDDAAAAVACLSADVRLVSDGGGEFRAALRPVHGADRVARFFVGLTRKLGVSGRFEVRTLNGLPAVVASYDSPREGWGRRFVLRCDLDARGAIAHVHIVVASAKLTHVLDVSAPA